MADAKTVVRDFYESYNGRDLDPTWERLTLPYASVVPHRQADPGGGAL